MMLAVPALACAVMTPVVESTVATVMSVDLNLVTPFT